MSQFSQKVTINGDEYELTGNVDFSNLTIKKTGTDIPDPEPSGPTKPTEGIVKEGGWGADLLKKELWKVINMKDFPEQFKIVDGAGKNIATNFKTKEVAENFISYFKVNPFPPVETPTPPVIIPPGSVTPGSGTDKYGTKLLVADGSVVEYECRNNFRDDGKRFDFRIDGADKGTEAQGYFRFTADPVDDEVSIKWSEVSHSGHNDVQCYDSGVSIKDGKSRMRFENPHPEYSDNLGGGQGVPLNDKFIGYKGVWTPNTDGSVTVKLYQDAGNNEGDKPANEWKEVYNYTDTKYKRSGPHPEVTLRIDDPAKQGQKNLVTKWLSVATITK